MKSDARAAVAIVGAGFSGTMLAAELARRGVSSVLFEGAGREGLGTAYSTTEPAHLLNVPAAKMSAWADDPDHFAREVEAAGGTSKDFAERRAFGRYLRGILSEAVASGLVDGDPSAGAFCAARGERLADWCRGWRRDHGRRRWPWRRVTSRPSRSVEPSSSPHASSTIRGSRRARRRLLAWRTSNGDVLIVGTGLTMVDMVLSLDAAGHRGRIVALSRRGQIPRAHADFEPAPVDAGRGSDWAMLRPCGGG